MKSNTDVLSIETDAMGTAIAEFNKTGKAGRLRVLSSMFEEDEIPVKHLFRSVPEMPELERKALELARGRILDVGAGAGCHSLALQQRGEEVTAIDISPLSCETMLARGICNVRCVNLFDKRLVGPFDTILMLMNGIGIAGKLKQLPTLLFRLRELLAPGGQLIVDSSDLKYLYENEDGSYDIDPLGNYYGEVDYRMCYRKVMGETFDWLYVDPQTLKLLAESTGFSCEIVANGGHYDYLAVLH